jgi:methionyl-tRNA formyltransferase
MHNLNFVFFGTPDVASETLEILKANGYLPSLIVTTPDKPQGRKMVVTPPPVKAWAQKNNIPYLQPEKITPDFIEEFKKLNTDLSIVVAYGKILPEELIKIPRLGTINIHYSLLPKYRGASPVEACLLNGDTETGVSIQQMAFKLDSGDIIVEEKLNIDINDIKNTLREKLIKIGGDLLCKIIPDIFNQNLNPIAQDESRATFCKKIKKEDGEIDPNGNALGNWNKYRAFFGWPGVFFFINGKRIKITKARYENDSFVIERVIPEGKKEIDFKEVK